MSHHPGDMAVRAALVIASLLVLGWAAVLLRDHYTGQSAFAELLAHPNLPASRFDHEMKRLKDAEFLNPDSTLQLYRGSAWVARRRPGRAARVLEALVRREPENFEAWGVLYLARRESDPQRAPEALAQIRRLRPLGGR